MVDLSNERGVYGAEADATTSDLLIAVAVTLIGAAIAWIFSSGVPLIGIDDAAITRAYAENVANGHGIVYNVGGERVEGSTAFLWMLVLAGAYLITSSPEILIIGLSLLITLWAVNATLGLTRLMAVRVNADPDRTILFVAVGLLAAPGYFLWTVWTMMELALWSAMLIWLVYRLVRRSGDSPLEGRIDVGVVVAALALPLIRPEGVAVAVGLLGLSALISRPTLSTSLVGAGAALASWAGVTVFRVQYFGFPVPNTFYAKVSSDYVQGLVDGVKYLFSFLLNAPFVEVAVVLWAAAALAALFRFNRDRDLAVAILMPAAAVMGILATYAALGGDHFALWRFYQPIAPLLVLIVALGLSIVWGGFGAVLVKRGAEIRFVGLTLAAGAILVSWVHYYQSRFDVRKEYTLVEQGLSFGSALNTVSPRPSIGVGPAGGVALAYDGHIYDLLGLNWVEMAHANPVKIGMRNHASFEKSVFWKHTPDMVAIFNRPCGRNGGIELWLAADSFDGLLGDSDFRAAYEPILFRDGRECWPSFAKTDWLDLVDDARIERLAWSDVRMNASQ